MRNKQNGFVIPLLIIAILAVGVGGGVYYSKSKSKSQTFGNHSDMPSNSQGSEGQKSIDFSRGQDLNASSSGKTVEVESNIKGNTNIVQNLPNIKSSMTLEELLAVNKGKTLVCKSSSVTPEGADISSTTYMSGGNVRADSVTVYKGRTDKGGVIVKGNNIYSWTGNQGMKIALTGGFDLSGALNMAQGGSASDAKSTYTCEPWVVDSSKFTVPSSVQFQDFGSQQIPSVSPEMIQNIMKGDFE